MPNQPMSRRGFLGQMALASAAAAVSQAPEFLRDGRWFASVSAQTGDLLHDTYNGLMAFVVPGHDAYSTHQGVATTEPGGVDAGAIDALIATIDLSTPFVPQFSATVAALLNGVAQLVNPAAIGPFLSPFAQLSYAEKAIVFQFMDGHPDYKVLAGVLPALVAFFAYAEAGVFDPATRSLTGTPLGWTLSNYQGVSDGRDEFRGYLRKDS
jgi:hypothetical protein